MMVTVVAIAMSVAAAVGVVIVVERNNSSSVSRPLSEIGVHHTRIEFALEGHLECAKPIAAGGTFATMVIDTYSDRAGRQWRDQITYPDGSTRDLIATGSAVNPTGMYERGDYRVGVVGCVGPNNETFVLGSGPGQRGFYTLNVSDELADNERALVVGFAQQGTRVDGDHVDGRGRRSELWQERIDGFAGYGNDNSLPLTQVNSWWVDPSDGVTVFEHQYTNTVEQLGTATETATLVADETLTVSTDFFDTSGYRRL